MTPRERVEAALFRRPHDRVPFTAYAEFVPQCAVERSLRNDGLCLVHINIKRMGFTVNTPACAAESLHYTERGTGRSMIRTRVRTPRGNLTWLGSDVGYTVWRHEMPFKGPEDYAPLIAYVEDMRIEPDYGTILGDRAMRGDDVFIMPAVGFSPLIDIIITWMGVETFAIEWAERRDEVMRLYRALLERDRQLFRVLADGPLPAIDYCGNISPQVVGHQRCEELVFPVYEEFADILHEKGKLLVVHLDADCGPLADLVAKSRIDVIDAFTPAPDTDMSVAQARAAWPDKVLWVNFPSSQHLASDKVIRETTSRIIEENGGDDLLLIGITEDVPPDCWQRSFQAIGGAIRGYSHKKS
jgi:hypothetical protein